MADTAYTPPKVWSWDKESGGRFSKLNRPIAGATHETTLPRGEHPFQLYSLGTPNGIKVTILFEELLLAGHSGAEYDAWIINIMDADQFGSGFVSVNPNSKIPGLLDCSGPKPFRVFESGAILLHLAEKFEAFIPSDPAARAECLSWLMWQMSTGPVLGGGFGHFYAYAPEKYGYPINRYAMEAKRSFDVADRRLAESRYLAGDEFTIADIANYAWMAMFVHGKAYDDGAQFLSIPEYESVGRWVREIDAREGVKRGRVVNLDGEGKIRERHSAADIEAVMKQA
ncbi:MAG: glutathione-dependent disulfide-bond oxidoreductase [Alphaproteobacteria bacterium]|nr:glutathione-dependent disulfide-bond oxidoreductase [Alphaproteobacteria bacterium]